MPSATARAHTAPPEADPHAPDGGNPPDDAKADSGAVKKSEPEDKAPGLFVLVFPYGGAQITELYSEEQAASRVSSLTYASKQHRKEAEEADETLPDGGGAHEINRRDIHVYRLNATEVTDF